MKVHRKYTKVIIILVCIAALAGGGLYNHVQNQKLSVTFYHMDTEKNISGLRILELSDLHLKEFGPDNADLVKKVSALHPDIIAVVGDMTMEDNPDHSMVIRLVKRLTEIAPVFYSWGNHEYQDTLYNKNSTLIKDMEEAGAICFDNKYVEVKVGRNKLKIGGVCKNAFDILRYTGSQNMLRKLSDEQGFTVLLSHYPEGFLSDMEGYPFDLVLCGHAHGGMVRLPFTDGLYSPDQGLFPKLTSGMRELCGSTVVVSRGLGTSHSYEWRVNNRPEIVVVDVN